MQAPWAQIIIMHQDRSFTPDAEKLMFKSVRCRKMSGLYTSAIVLIENTARFAIEYQVSEIYRSSDIAHSYFDTEQQARVWLDKVMPV
ncbi:MAG: hypothetical protein MJK10_09275 [Pseudomonadales bacterium]|nr:hypothetical protein [Pseudomonadales bacterium]NRA16235.1 hypothetical protein [Oceanospirillaceae bacterium]